MQSETLTDFDVLIKIVQSKLKPTKRIKQELELLSTAPSFIVKSFLQAYQHVIINKNESLPINECHSLIAYQLGITSMDPGLISCHYPVEPGSYPDIDTDYANPDLVKDYIREKYGEEKVISIPTYSRYKVKSLLKDLCRVVKDAYGETLVSFEEINALTKKLPFKIDSQIVEDMATDDINLEDDDYEMISYDEIFSNKDIQQFGRTYPQIFQHFKLLYSSPRHRGKHAAGVIITPVPACEIIPLSNTKKVITAEFSEGQGIAELGALGFVKIDVLGLKTLKMLDTCNRFIMSRYALDEGTPSPCSCYKQGVPCDSNYLLPFKILESTGERMIDFNAVCLNIPKVYKAIGNFQNEGVFQFEPSGISAFTHKYGPKEFWDLAFITSLYRPGPLDAKLDKQGIPLDPSEPEFHSALSAALNFIERRSGNMPVVYPSQKVKEILEKSYGIAVFQETLSQMIMAMTNCSFGEAEKVRKFLTKIKPELVKTDPDTIAKIQKFYKKFHDDGIQNGCNEKEISSVWNLILPFARYGFNKSHAVSYSLLTYQTAFCRSLFPKEYLTSLMFHNVGVLTKDKGEKILEYIRAAQKLDFKVEKPNINLSDLNFSINERGDICSGLTIAKGVGDKAAISIINNRNEFGKFTSIEDFLSRKIEWRLVNIKVLKVLALVGAFDEISPNRQLTWTKIQLNKNRIKAATVAMVEVGVDENGKTIKEVYVEDFSDKEKKGLERDTFGFLFEDKLTKNKINIEKYQKVLDGIAIQKRKATSIGTINEITTGKQQKNGLEYARISALTTDGSKQQWMIFGHLWPHIKDRIKKGEIYCVLGKLDDKKTFLIDTIQPLENIIDLV